MVSRAGLTLVTFFAFLFTAAAQEEKPPPPPPAVKLVANPQRALQIAYTDAKLIFDGKLANHPDPLLRASRDDLPFLRYAWLRRGPIDDLRALAGTLQYINRSPINHAGTRPAPLAGFTVARFDLRNLARDLNDIKSILPLWEELQFDPDFSTFLTHDNIQFLLEANKDTPLPLAWRRVKEWVKVPCEPYKQGNKTYDYYEDERWTIKKVVLADAKDVDVVRFAGQHLDSMMHAGLCQLLSTNAPIVRDGYFISRVLSSVQEDGVFRSLFGGLYYEFAGIEEAPKNSKFTDEDLLYERLGIGNTAQGVTAAKIFANLRSDRRLGMFRSHVTGKPRQVEWFPQLGKLAGVVFTTHDLRKQDIDIATHPMANLLNFKDAARETIFTKSNGFHGFALFNGQGKLQRAAPQNVVSDWRIAEPPFSDGDTSLQGAISCIRCHGSQGGIRDMANEVQQLYKKLRIFGDVSKRNDLIPDTLRRIEGLYRGDPDDEGLLVDTRNAYARAILRATGPWKEGLVEAQTNITQLLAKQIAEIYDDYNYKQIDAQRACAELGFNVGGADALEVFTQLMQPPPQPAGPFGVIPEDPRIGGILAGLKISRTDWAFAYSFAASRAQFNWSRMQEKK